MTNASVIPIGGTFAALIEGIDPTAVLSTGEAEFVWEAVLQYGVVFLRGHRPPTAEEQVAFAQRFGDLSAEHLFPTQNPAQPALVLVETKAPAEREQATGPAHRSRVSSTPPWHVDASFSPEPPKAAVLSAQVVPPTGGDTAWFDLVTAYEALSPTLREWIDRLHLVHDASLRMRRLADNDPSGQFGARLDQYPPVAHPLVRIHPETGRRALFLSPTHDSHITELAPDESQALLAFLNGRLHDPELSVRWRWRVGDVAFYDNRSTAHRLIDNHGHQHRVLQRVSLAGDQPFGPAETDRTLVAAAIRE